MAEASIPVDLCNPGQVFACLGFLEAADVLLGDAEGGFDWRHEANVRFCLRVAGSENPFGVVLEFLAHAEIRRLAPVGYAHPPPRNKESATDEDEDAAAEQPLDLTETFPSPDADTRALPIRLVGFVSGQDRSLELGHWADASSRDDFKLYAGNRSAAAIARAMLRGTREKPKKGQSVGDLKSRGIDALWSASQRDLESKPFDVLTSMRGSFNFDPRGKWTAIDAGYSPDKQEHGVAGSPVVEALAAVGLEHARPRTKDRRVRYGAWSGFIAPILARPVLAGASVRIPARTFQFAFGGTKHNKVVTFAQEEINP